MNNKKYKKSLIHWMGDQDYKFFTTLNFNDNPSIWLCNKRLKDLHARLDYLALGPRWQKLSEQRMRSISFPHNAARNYHFHMLWAAPKSAQRIFQELPSIWQKLTAAGSADMKVIGSTQGLYGYCSRQMFMQDCDFILDGRI